LSVEKTTKHPEEYTRNSSGDEIANVNFLYDDIVHVRGYGTHVFTKYSEITQYNGDYVVQGHSRSPILVPIESSYTTSY